MLLDSHTFAPGPSRKDRQPGVETALFAQVCRVSHFLRDFRLRLHHGELSRAPLKLLRFQVIEETVECDWMAGSPAPWDVDLPTKIRQRHASLQAPRDAVDIRTLLFQILPQVEVAHVRVFRESTDYVPEMIISGCLHSNDNTSRSLHSLVMRARILGFRFRMEKDALIKI